MDHLSGYGGAQLDRQTRFYRPNRIVAARLMMSKAALLSI